MAELGRPWSLTTSYDIAFLHLILAALEGAPLEKRPCTALPFKNVPVRRLSEKNRRWLSATNILLMAEKCRDDWSDEGSWKARLGLKLAEGQIPKARDEVERSGFPLPIMTELSRRQQALEKRAGLRLEEYALPTCRLLGEIFAHISKLLERPVLGPPLRQLGQGLGNLIYMQDAAKDFVEDKKRGRFNALQQCAGEDWQSTLSGALAREMKRAKTGLRSLGLGPDEGIALQILEQLKPSPQASPARVLRRQSLAGFCEILLCCDASICCSPELLVCCPCPCDCSCCGQQAPSQSKAEPASNSWAQPPEIKPTLSCPACSGALLSKEYSKVEVDECPGCHGLWLDQGELEQLARLKRLPQRLLKIKHLPMQHLRPEGTRPCPRCSQILVGTMVKGVRVDICSDCRGLWLDQGELNELL